MDYAQTSTDASQPQPDHAGRLNEFREAAAAVRHAHKADTEAREALIVATRERNRTKAAHEAAMERFERAAENLQNPPPAVPAMPASEAVPPRINPIFASRPPGVRAANGAEADVEAAVEP